MPIDSPGAPTEHYQSRLELRLDEAARCQRRHIWLGYARLALVVAGLLLVWFSFYRPVLSRWWVVLPCAAFVVVARRHSAVLAQLSQARRAIAFFERGLARVQDRWSDLPDREVRVDAASSLYARDLDLFGRGGLFNLLCTARTSVGEHTLGAWLLEPAAREEIQSRQEAIAELREHLNLSEELASREGAEVAALDVDALAAWGAGHEQPVPHPLRWIAPLLVVLTLLAAVRWAMTDSPVLFVLAIMVDATVTYSLQKRIETIFVAAGNAADSLRLASALIALLEGERFESAKLLSLQLSFRDSHGGASKALAHLATMAQAIEWRRNFIVRALDVPLLYSVQLAGAVQAWRRAHGASVGKWLEALGEFEALVSLATFSFEHPLDPFPEIVEGAPCFEALQLGHPMIPAAKCVRNDVALAGETRLLLVSGSNMSGKSTLLRAVGVNTVLAMAGATVRATSLRLTPLHVGASIQVHDSLQEGQSRFYAEILRLRAICALAEQRPPALFLLDELLDGTNSHDRLTGATGIAHALVTSGAIGLISTHDLALTGMEEAVNRVLRNVHFEDRIENDVMRFDFKLREGVVTSSNGVALMRMVGLKV